MMKFKNKNEERFTKLGLKVAYYRKLKGITQEHLAELVDSSRTHISSIEASGVNKKVSINLLFNIADALEVPIYKFFDFENF